MSVFDMGVSEAIYTTINREIIFEHSSPVIAMRAQKNEVERRGMQWAHVKDAVAMIDTLSYLEERVSWLLDFPTFKLTKLHFRWSTQVTRGPRPCLPLKSTDLDINNKESKDLHFKQSLLSAPTAPSLTIIHMRTKAAKSRTTI